MPDTIVYSEGTLHPRSEAVQTVAGTTDRSADGKPMYTKESLLREGFLQLPLFVATRLLDDSPYLLDLARHRFRVFSW